MGALKTLDLDSYEDGELVTLAERVREAWADRDEAIRKATELRRQTWTVPVPDPWKQTARTFHSALAREIPARVVGTIGLREPVFSRTPPDDDALQAERAAAVERFLAAQFRHTQRHAAAPADAYLLGLDMLINKGAVCAGSIFAPHAWADHPTAFTLRGRARDDAGRLEILREWWRDERGQPVEDEEGVSERAAVRAYLKSVDLRRRLARPPIVRRVLDTAWCYPLIVDGRMLALFIFRRQTPLELRAAGFVLPRGDEHPQADATLGRSDGGRESLEVVTPNRVRYYLDGDPLVHSVFGKDGLVTNYREVPYSYRVGLLGGDLDYGTLGLPLLSLVDSHIRLIDTLETYALNAVHLASFPSFKVVYELKNDGTGVASIIDSQTGRKITSYDFKSGTIMDFGPGRDVQPLLHPGLNKDHADMVRFLTDEVKRIIPETLSGTPASSGFNTVQSSVQARAIFLPIVSACEQHHEELAVMDLKHVERTPGPIYMNLALPAGLSSRPRRVLRTRVTAEDVGGYYEVDAQIDREHDRVTLGAWALQLLSAGVVDKDFVRDVAGIADPEQMRYRVLRDRVEDDPDILGALKERAIRRFGLGAVREEAMARRRIQPAPDGTPLVQLPDGRLAGPGLAVPPRLPRMQGMAGAVLGGLNGATPVGRENLAASRNPAIGLAAPTPTGRDRLRRRGGALPGVGQRQPARPEPVPPAAP